MASRRERILILCKTYPSPSSKHSETSCVAGISETGQLVRLFPVPFRLINGTQQFKKWQWISAQVYQAPGDKRRESHKIYVDTINVEGAPLPTKNNWSARREALASVRVFSDFGELEEARIAEGVTLGLLKPARIVALDITAVDDPEWSEVELQKLVAHEQQAGLFDSSDDKAMRTLRKLPFAFHYRYECEVNGIIHGYRHKIADWEAGALYWNCVHSHGAAWETPFRAKVEESLPSSDLHLLMGTIHRFPNQWLIVSLIYPPVLSNNPTVQTQLPF